mmetsp:Transcript_396/g.822  ORF Transcript_396/g.822 Transcript_396/m.822 type:complete len:135 (-) Transcript_396:156-560(-)
MSTASSFVTVSDKLTPRVLSEGSTQCADATGTKNNDIVSRYMQYCKVIDNSSSGSIRSAMTETLQSCRCCGAQPTDPNQRLKRCGGCRVVRYCSVECQNDDWRYSHHLECEEMAKQKTSMKALFDKVRGLPASE